MRLIQTTESLFTRYSNGLAIFICEYYFLSKFCTSFKQLALRF